MDIYDKLKFLDIREMWVMLKDLGLMYCDVEDTEVENPETEEMQNVPKFIPRTDVEGMMSDIYVKYMEMNREQKKTFSKHIDKLIKGRNISAAFEENGGDNNE